MKGKLLLKPKVLFLFLILIFLISGCIDPNILTNKNEPSSLKTVTVDVTFRSFVKENTPIPDVTILVIRSDGKVVNKLVTNSNGEASKNITVPIDNRYPGNAALEKRGTVTVIAFKNGYKDTVLFEVPISKNDPIQGFYLKPLDPGFARNEPDVQLGNNHHLQILSLVEKYAPYAKAAK